MFFNPAQTIAESVTGAINESKAPKIAPQLPGIKKTVVKPIGMAQGPDLNEMRSKFFNSRRDEIQRNQIGQQQDAGEALNRRFTAMGQAGSGAAINAEIKSRQAIEDSSQKAMGELNNQDVQAQMSGALADRDFMLKRDLANEELASKSRAQDLAEGMFDLEADSQEFNKGISTKEANKKRGFFGDK